MYKWVRSGFNLMNSLEWTSVSVTMFINKEHKSPLTHINFLDQKKHFPYISWSSISEASISCCHLALAVQRLAVLGCWQRGASMLLGFSHPGGQWPDDEGGLDLSSHNIDSVAIVSHWPCGAQWCRTGQEGGQPWQWANPAATRSQTLSVPADSPLNPRGL